MYVPCYDYNNKIGGIYIGALCLVQQLVILNRVDHDQLY